MSKPRPRSWPEREAQRFWPALARRWVVALLFALASAWAAGAGYAYIANAHTDELRALRARAAFVESIEDRVVTMTPAERRQFDALMKRSGSAKR